MAESDDLLGAAGRSPQWHSDVLGAGYESLTLHLGEGRVSTLVRHFPAGGDRRLSPPQAVLFLHGWSDYFFNRELADFFSTEGIAFYALDLHNHGRSLREGDLGGFVADLNDYDGELSAAFTVIHQDLDSDPDAPLSAGSTARIALMGHSTGGLVAALWAARNAERPPQLRASHLMLNSPWLEMHGSSLVRHATYSLVEPLARWRPTARMRLPPRNFYWRSIAAQAGGEWDLDTGLRPPNAFPVRAGWMSAILAGHARVARGLDITVPILVLMSARSLNGPRWREGMRSADAVLDIGTMASRALILGDSVTVERIDGGLHDVLLSEKSVRQDAYRRLRRWIHGYLLTESEDE
ncbi:alpha/beta hydrolase [Psychromicrobium xiongbiense]|uniref:alpha/beta hydrolase n=1 Tax=Psychromicrobium xiongbiense TaxID=3051184 RepID=UPI0025572836|nr:alpha/beta hydrolase [Psychromicrobium sp. YIM S02556]